MSVKLGDFIPPFVAQAARSVMRSVALSQYAQSFIHGADYDGRHAGRAHLSQPYRQSAWVRAAVNHVVGEVQSRPLCFIAGDQEFRGNPAFAAWWEAPALGSPTLTGQPSRLSRAEVQRNLAAWWKLEGEYFLLLDDAWLLGAGARNPGTLTPFVIARPDRMQAIIQGGVLAGWRWSDSGGRQHILVPDQVIHRKNFNPYDDFRGVGDLQAASVAAESAFYTGVYIRELMRNNGDTGFIVVAKSGVVDDKQREQLKADLRAKRIALQQGRALDLFLTGDITVDHPAERAASTDLNVGKGLSHQEVFVAFGVPPSMAEVKAAYSIGKDSDYFQLILRTCIPTGCEVADGLAQVATRMAGRPLTAELEWEDHPVMQELRIGRLEALDKLWSKGMPVKDASAYLGLDMAPYPGWDVGYLPFSVASVDSGMEPAVDPTQDPALAEPNPIAEEDGDVAKIRLLLLARQRGASRQCIDVTPKTGAADPFALFACECHGGAGIAQRADRPARDIKLWQDHMAKRRGTVKSFQSALGRVLMAARTQTLRNIGTYAKSAPAAGTVQKAGAAAHLLFDLAQFAASFFSAVGSAQKTGLETAGQQFFTEVGKDDPFLYPPAEVLDYLAARKNKLKDVPQETYDRLKEQLEEGLLAGETQAQLEARVKATFNAIDGGAAKRIALTETAAVYGAGRNRAMRTAGVKRKAWLTSGNANVRAAHAQAGEDYDQAHAIPVDEAFIVDGEALDYPGDDAGSPGNVINCHCVSIAVAAAKE